MIYKQKKDEIRCTEKLHQPLVGLVPHMRPDIARMLSATRGMPLSVVLLLTVVETRVGDELVSHETYTKEVVNLENRIKVYAPIVECEKVAVGGEYKKFQFFELERTWTKMKTI